jgi:hypothetical protein
MMFSLLLSTAARVRAALRHEVAKLVGQTLAAFRVEPIEPLPSLPLLDEQSRVAHAQLRQAEFKVEAWAMVQEISEMTNRCSSLKTAAHRLMIQTSSPQEAP